MAEMEEIAVHLDNGVLTLGFNRPDKRNAITGEMYAELADQLNAAADNDEVGAVFTQLKDIIETYKNEI